MAASANATLSDARRKGDFFPQKRKKSIERTPQGGGNRKLSLNEPIGFRHVGRKGKPLLRGSAFTKTRKCETRASDSNWHGKVWFNGVGTAQGLKVNRPTSSFASTGMRDV